MKQKTLGGWLKAAIFTVGGMGLLACLALVPMMGLRLKNQYPEFSDRFWPWMAFTLLTAVPCAAMLALGWKIADNIGHGRPFVPENARLLRWIAGLAAGDAAFFFTGNVVLWLTGMSHPAVVLASLTAVLAGNVAAVGAACLSHLAQKASALQEQCDWTI